MADLLCVDLTALRPAAMMDGGPLEAIWPAFCLPYFRGELPLVGAAAMQHRRSSDPDAWDDEARLDLDCRGRFLLAEGWLAMTLEPDSFQPSNAVCSWTPQGDRGERVELPFPDVIRSVLRRWSSPEMWLAMIVPDGLGPGPRQEILDRIESDFGRVQLVPRSVAAALDWCSRQEVGNLVGRAKPTQGERAAHLLITTTPADTWEAAVVPIRFEGESAKPPLCPVHQRVHYRSEAGYAGIEQCLPAGVLDGDTPAEKLWASWLEFDGHGHRFVERGRDSVARTAFADWSLPGRLHSGWKPGDATDEVNANLRQVISVSGIQSWVHVSSLGSPRIPNQLRFLGEFDLPTPELATEDTLLAGGLELLRLVAGGKTPYYESLAQVDLCVEGTNDYRDPVPEWKPLIEATEVPAGRDYTSPEPIMDLSLPPGEVAEIDLILRSERRNREQLGSLRVVQERPQEVAVPVKVNARLSPGQGLVRFEVESIPPGSFLAAVRESQLTPRSALPQTLFSWPPGSAWVATDPAESRLAAPRLRQLVRALRGDGDLLSSIESAREIIGKWNHKDPSRPMPPGVPAGVHPLFVYDGVFPSDSREACDSVEPLLAQISAALPQALDAHERLESSLLSLASWLYARCPEDVLERVRASLEGSPSALPESYYSCVGNCFTRSEDHRRFYRHLLHIRGGLGKYPWIRAWRNLARFRVDSMRMDVISTDEMGRLFDEYLERFGLSEPSRHGKSVFLHCCYLAPHLLKRRRFDPGFLPRNGSQTRAFGDLLHWAASRSPNVKLRRNVECALEFLERRADVSTLQRLRDAE